MDTSKAERYQCVSRYPPHLYMPLRLTTCTTFRQILHPEFPSDKNHVRHKRLWVPSLNRTPKACIKSAYLLRPASNSIESLETKAAPSPLQPATRIACPAQAFALIHVDWAQPQLSKVTLQVTLPRLSSPFESISLPVNRHVLNTPRVVIEGSAMLLD